jgi:hypothetical protein
LFSFDINKLVDEVESVLLDLNTVSEQEKHKLFDKQLTTQRDEQKNNTDELFSAIEKYVAHVRNTLIDPSKSGHVPMPDVLNRLPQSVFHYDRALFITVVDNHMY